VQSIELKAFYSMPWRIFKILLTIMLLLSAWMIVPLLWLAAEPKVISLPWLIESDVALELGFFVFSLFFTFALWLNHREPGLLPPAVWLVLRFYWTLVFLLFVFVIVSSARSGGIEILMIMAAQCPGMAATWLDGDYKKPLVYASANTLFALSLAYWTYRIVIGDVYFPSLHCGADLFCELQNLFYALSGPAAAATPWALASGNLLYASFRAFRQWRNSERNGATKIPKG
jgi:hypothetical protein